MLSLHPFLLFVAQTWLKTAFAQSYRNITYGQTVTYGNNTYAETYLTPTAEGTTWYWSQAITPAILGTVYVIINDHNQTQTVTSTNSAAVANNTQYLKNGTLSLLTRTDVNELGTVTAVLPTAGGRETIVAYPTPYFTVVRPISWEGLFPDVQHGVTCCNPHLATSSAVPQNHYSFPSLTGSTNPADPKGWLYLLATSRYATFSGSQNLSSLLAPVTITSVKQHCPHFLCPEASTVLGAEAVQTVGALLETTTVRMTGTFSRSAAPAATAEQGQKASESFAKPSVVAGPVSAARPTPSIPGTKPAPTAVQQVSKIVEVSNVAVPPISRTSAENIGVAIGQLLDTTVPPNTDTISASKGGASAVQAAQKTIDTPPKPGSPESTANIGDVIGSVLAPGPSRENARVQSSVKSEPPQVAVGTTSVPVQATRLAMTIAGVSTFVPAVIVGSQTVAVGGSESVGGIPVAVITAGGETAVVVDGESTHIIPQATAAQEVGSQPPIVIGSNTITANPDSQYIVAGQTLIPGSTITVDNTPIALQTNDQDATTLVVGTRTSILQTLPESTEGAAPIVIGGSTITANQASEYVVDGQTLRPGSAITIGRGSSASVVMLQTSGSETVLVLGSSTSVLQYPTTAVLTVDSARITPMANSEYLVGSRTLVPGASGITVSGVEYSLAPDGGEIVVGSSTHVLTSDADIGGYIWSALGGSSARGTSLNRPEASTTTASGASDPTGESSQAEASATQKDGAADVARLSWLWLVIALTFLIANVM